jgi:anti-sigma B factor antagonist
MANLQIDERSAGEVTILGVKGKLILDEVDLLRNRVTSLVDQNRRKLLLDLGGVPYVDSAGLGEIVRCHTTVTRQGGQLKLLNLTKRIQDLMTITKLSNVFDTYDSEPDAIKSFS